MPSGHTHQLPLAAVAVAVVLWSTSFGISAVRVRKCEHLDDICRRPLVELGERTHAPTVETARPGIPYRDIGGTANMPERVTCRMMDQ